MARTRSVIVCAFAATLMLTQPVAALDAPLIWLAHGVRSIDLVYTPISLELLEGRAVDIYAEEPTREQLLGLAVTLAQASIASYSDTESAQRRKLARVNLEPKRFVSKEPNTQVLFAQDSRSLVVAIRGSQEKADWILDGAQATTWGLPLRTHPGFFAAARAIHDEVRYEVSSALNHGKKVFLTGHSLGGAVAQLLAKRLARGGRLVTAVHTFGSPAVGNASWAASYDEELGPITHRWVNEEDPIVCYPLTQEGWEQAGRSHVLSDSGLVLDSSMTTCEDVAPRLSVICEPETWWGTALSWVTGAVGVCESSDLLGGYLDLIRNLETHTFSAHKSAAYRGLIGAELPPEVLEGVLFE